MAMTNGSQILAAAFGTGNGGAIGITTSGGIQMSGGAFIENYTAANGRAGDVTINAAGTLVISGAVSGLYGLADTGSTGDAGKITVTANAIALTAGGAIQSETAGSGQSGDITINATGSLTLSGAAEGNGSGIYALADPGSTGDVGKVVLTAHDVLR